MDPYYKDVYDVFALFDAIDGSYTPSRSAEESMSGKFAGRIALLQSLKKKADDCRHKAVAARYSLAMIEREMAVRLTAEDVKGYSEMIAHKMCREAELKNEVLIYETESFLFQIKSNMDIIVQLLKHLYPYLKRKGNGDNESFSITEGNPYNTVDLMRNSGGVKMADFFQKQVDEWFKELNGMRNNITHRSGLPGFDCLIFRSDTEEVVKPKMPNGRDVDEYCRDIFDKLMKVYKTIAEEFVMPKLFSLD
jgi:hypothetical protein